MLGQVFSSQSGLLGQLVRFGLVGGLVTLFYLTATTLLYRFVGLPFQLALAIGFVASLLLHFTLQRLFVWMHADGFALPFRHQVGRYVTMAGAQYGCTVAATALLPGTIGVSTEVVYLATMAVVTCAGFLLMRFVIFHGRSHVVESSAAPRPPAGSEPLAMPASFQRGEPVPAPRCEVD